MQISIENLDKISLPLKKAILKSAIFYILSYLDLKQAEVNLYFISNQRIKLLNRIYFKKNCPTDVLVFNLGKHKKDILAEIFISLKLAKDNCRLYKNSFAGEVILYIIHALLHILGFEHKKGQDRKIMFRKQNTLLDKVSSYIYKKHKIRIN